MAKKQIEQTEIEAPYELPEGWKWMLMPEVVTWGSGGTPKATEPKYYTNGTIPWLIIADLNDSIVFKSSSKITKEGLENSTAKLVPPNTLLVAMYGSIGKLGITGIECCTNQAIAFAKELKNVTTKYMFYYMSAIKPLLIAMGRGGTQQNISQTLLNTLRVPLPPTLEEQQRIVNRIETLFEKLDLAKEKAQNVVDIFETRKASILHKAFTGELTKKWREENGVSYKLIKSKFSEICTKITDGFHNSPKPVVNGYPYIMAGDIRDDGINFNNGLFMDEKNHNELYKKASPSRGDILIVNIGAGTGKAAIIDVDFEFSFKNCAILKLKRDIVNPMYVYQFFLLEKNNILINITRGGAQPFLSLKMINDMETSYPSLPEQTEIVRILDVILEKETKAKEAAEAVLEQIDVLKKSILARAFRGKL